MPGWRRNQRSGAPAAVPAVQPPASPRDDWRTLPPLRTVLRSPITTATAGAFGDTLSTWRNPSFLAPLGHHIDPDGPAGLITGLARASAGPERPTYYHDRPLPLAGGVPAALQRTAAVQRTAALWSPPPQARSRLTTAPEPDLSPVPVPVVSAGPAEPETTSTDPAIATNQEAEPPGRPAEPLVISAGPAEPPATPARPAENHAAGSAPAGQAPASGSAWPGGRPQSLRPPEQPLVADRGPGHVTAQRQQAQSSPQPPPRRRLGLGAPLSDPPGGLPVRTVSASDQPVVARSAAGPVPRDPGGSTPHRPVPPEPETGPAGPAGAPEPARAATVSVQPVRPDRTGPDDPGEPGPAEAAAPAAGMSPAEAPLIGEQPPAWHAVRPSATQLTAPVAPPAMTPSGKAPPPSGARATVQRSVTRSGASPGTLAPRSPAPASVPQPPAEPGPSSVSLTPDPRPADQPAGPPGRLPVLAQRLPSGSPVEAVLSRRAEAAPLLGDRPPALVMEAPSGAGPRPSQASVPRELPREAPVQRSVHPLPPASRPGGQAGTQAGTQAGAQAGSLTGRPAAGHREPAAGYPDPGAIAVATGLARRDPDGSVVFDLSPAPPPRHLESAGWHAAAGQVETVQRQEADAGPAEAPAPPPDREPGAVTMAAPAPAPAPSVTSAPSGTQGPGPVSPPIDELVRQLFGPLTARLKAELRLDRERTGLLTDLRR